MLLGHTRSLPIYSLVVLITSNQKPIEAKSETTWLFSFETSSVNHHPFPGQHVQLCKKHPLILLFLDIPAALGLKFS